jgi:hypothetical protein
MKVHLQRPESVETLSALEHYGCAACAAAMDDPEGYSCCPACYIRDGVSRVHCEEHVNHA